ncbi:rhodanese-like domain-containing protein [Nocardioides sp.]|uniref:rhodanese-like domain-containing protein n=1 Tax=Nocardioides sp. TaxID=35761 RepID=UPI002735928C|nr:rhodanese-like domain-containing protein [Nocardioides sp.]MDP3890661.1 rhodanese-like domain-containing protein [Nocardioides sp.]
MTVQEIDVQEINVAELEVAVRQGATLVDVREPVEYAEGHVPGALSVPMGQLPTRVRELDTSAPVYLICASGNRSGVMCEVLRGVGIRAVNVSGGTAAWARSGRTLAGGRA